MRPSQVRRMGGVERALASCGRVHYLFRGLDETDEGVKGRMRAMIASGEARANDQFVIFCWQSPDDGG